MKSKLEFDGYEGTIEYDHKEECFWGHILNIDENITYKSKDYFYLEFEFILAVKLYKIKMEKK